MPLAIQIEECNKLGDIEKDWKKINREYHMAVKNGGWQDGDYAVRMGYRGDWAIRIWSRR